VSGCGGMTGRGRAMTCGTSLVRGVDRAVRATQAPETSIGDLGTARRERYYPRAVRGRGR
jgi:hypothetical protein